MSSLILEIKRKISVLRGPTERRVCNPEIQQNEKRDKTNITVEEGCN